MRITEQGETVAKLPILKWDSGVVFLHRVDLQDTPVPFYRPLLKVRRGVGAVEIATPNHLVILRGKRPFIQILNIIEETIVEDQV